MAIENTFKFLTDRGLEQYDAIIKEYMNATYAKKGEAGDSVFVKANFTSVGNEYKTILHFDTEPGPDWSILINWTDNDEIEITSYSLINCSDSNGQLISIDYDSSNDSLLIEVNSQEYGSNTNETIRIDEFFWKHNGEIHSKLTTGAIAKGDWSRVEKLGTLDIDSTQANEYMNSGKVPMSIVEIEGYKTPIYCVVAFEEEAYFEFPLVFVYSNRRMICILVDNELYLGEIKSKDVPTKDVEFLKNITYQELKDLRDSEQLVPGMQYRIIDYECTTSQANTHSMGHSFDIIVTADSEDTLNENARAICRDNDSYFDNSNLEAWEIKYCLDNDTNRFSWADENNGHGVIYYMKDEHNNECPYDFKNIRYYVNNTWKYTFDNNGYDDSLGNGCYGNIIKPNGNSLNFITFSVNCHNNVFDINCHNINIPNSCSNNTFGNNCTDINIGVNSTNNTFGNNCYDINAGITFYNNILQNNCRSLAFSQGGPLLDYVMNCIVYLGTGSDEITLLVPVTTYSIIPQFVCNSDANHIYVWTPFNN